jgi:phosphohistidine phosphatase
MTEPPAFPPARTLLLMRHAKSSWADARLADSDRPLNGRGRRAALVMAPLVAAWQPQHILCSAALRARQTLEPILEALNDPVPAELTTALHETSEPAYWRALRNLPNQAQRVLLVGHNPGLADLCFRIIGAADPAVLARIATKLPTATLIVLECPVARWSDLAPHCASVLDITRPADLAG